MKAKLLRLARIRATEPSTWAGVSALGLIFGLPAGTIDALGSILAGVAGLAAIFLPEDHRGQ